VLDYPQATKHRTVTMTMPNPLRYFVVDAFTDRPFAGNPAAVVPLSGWPDKKWLQNVAMEMNLSETAFLVPNAQVHRQEPVRLLGGSRVRSGGPSLGPGLQAVVEGRLQAPNLKARTGQQFTIRTTQPDDAAARVTRNVNPWFGQLPHRRQTAGMVELS
jgi:hypothetical protein